jgi:hypothetical protein
VLVDWLGPPAAQRDEVGVRIARRLATNWKKKAHSNVCHSTHQQGRSSRTRRGFSLIFFQSVPPCSGGQRARRERERSSRRWCGGGVGSRRSFHPFLGSPAHQNQKIGWWVGGSAVENGRDAAMPRSPVAVPNFSPAPQAFPSEPTRQSGTPVLLKNPLKHTLCVRNHDFYYRPCGSQHYAWRVK